MSVGAPKTAPRTGTRRLGLARASTPLGPFVWDEGGFQLTRLEHRGDVPELVVRAGDGGGAVTDLFVYERDR